MSLDIRILSSLDMIYAAAADQDLWPDVLRNLLTITESQAASFCVLQGNDQPRLPVFHYLNVEPRDPDRSAFMREYLEGGMVEHDPTVQHIVANPQQRLIRDSSFISDMEKDRHIYYDWHHRFSDTRHRLAGMISAGPQTQSGITLHRTRQVGDFSEAQVECFRFLLPHIERAVKISFKLGTLCGFRETSLEFLDASSNAIIFLDRDARVLFANHAARALAAADDGLLMSHSGLSLQNSIDDRRLQQLIGGALLPNSRSSSGATRALRRSGKRPLAILVSTFSSNDKFVATIKPAVCIVISDPERQALVPASVLKSLFGLTRSESRLAERLASGEALPSIAASLGITYGTARTQLATIFRKTGTKRQGELVKVLLRDVPQPSI
jgi:DNA-binding CsgD family transcriptional regulator